MGADSKLPMGSIIRNGQRGSVYYKRMTDGIIDGGVSPTFPDSIIYNTSTTVKINSDISDTHYIYQANIPEHPTSGGGELSGMVFRFTATDTSPNSEDYYGYKGLLFYRLKDLPVQKGAINVSNESITSAPTGNHSEDLLVYSTSSKNKRKNPNWDYIIQFGNLSGKLEGEVVEIDGSLVEKRDPYILYEDAMSDGQIFKGHTSALKKYKVYDTTLGCDIIRLKEKRGAWFGAGLIGKNRYTVRDNRKWYNNDPEMRTDYNHFVKFKDIEVLRDNPEIRDSLLPDGETTRFVPERKGMIKQAMTSPTYRTAASDDTNGATPARDISYAKLDAGSKYSRGDGIGLHMHALWRNDDNNIPRYGDETASGSTLSRAVCSFTTSALPVPTQLDSTFGEQGVTGTSSNHPDPHSICGRIDIVLKVNTMAHAQAFHPLHLEHNTSTTDEEGNIGMERGLFILFHEHHPTPNDEASTYSPTGHIFDYHTGLEDDANDSGLIGGGELFTAAGTGIMGMWIGNILGRCYILPMAHRANALNSNHDWDANWAITDHEYWYLNHGDTNNTNTTNAMVVTSAAGASLSQHFIEIPFGVFIRLSVIIHNPDDKYASVVVTNAETEEMYGVFEMPNGFTEANSTNDNDGLNDFSPNSWPKFLSMFLQTNKCEINTSQDSSTASNITNFTECDWETAVGRPGLGHNTKYDMESSVYVDGIYGAGFFSDATNSTARWGNGKFRSPIEMTNDEVVLEVDEQYRAENTTGGTDCSILYSKKNSGIYGPNRNTILVGHEDYKAILGNNESTWSGNEKAAWWFHNFSQQSVFTAGELNENDFGADGTITAGQVNIIRGDDSAAGHRLISVAGSTSGSSPDIYLGKQMTEEALTESADSEIGDTAGDIAFATYSGSSRSDSVDGGYYLDGFSQKGLMTLDFALNGKFAAREHILASAKILRVLGPRELIVANGNLLRTSTGPRATSKTFRVYKYNQNDTTSSYNDVKIEELDTSTGYVRLDTVITDEVTDDDCQGWFISPVAYWVWMHFFNFTTDGSSNATPIANRTYDSMDAFIIDKDNGSGSGSGTDGFIPQSVATAGFTWNECLITDGSSLDNSWNLSFDEEVSSVDLITDYGFGTIKDETNDNKPTMFDGPRGFVNKVSVDKAEAKYIDLGSVIQVDKNLKPGDPVAFIAKGALDNRNGENFGIEIGTSTHGTATTQPQLFAQYFDKLPSTPVLHMNPLEDNEYYPEFTWEIEDDDLWYGLILVSEATVQNQYQDAIFHYPMNVEGVHGSTVADNDLSNRVQNLNSDTGTIKNEIQSGTTPKFDVEGIAGNAIRTNSGSVKYQAGSGNTLSDLDFAFSIICHVTPDVYDSGTMGTGNNAEQYIWEHDGASLIYHADEQKYSLRVHKFETGMSARTHPTDSVLVEGYGPVADGETPTMICAVFDAELKSANVKLYIDGKLAAQSGPMQGGGSGADQVSWFNIGSGDANTDDKDKCHVGTGQFQIGSDQGASASDYFDGLIEEVVVYKVPVYPVVPSDQKFVLTKKLHEVARNGDGPQAYQVRLFVKDYHNFRGTTTGEVAASSSIRLQKAAFRLN